MMMAETIVLTTMPGHCTRRSIPSAGQIQSDHSGSNNIGNANTAIPISARATARHGRSTRLIELAATAEPRANPRKKKPKTRLLESVLAPSKSIKRRVQSSSCVSAEKPLTNASPKAKRILLQPIVFKNMCYKLLLGMCKRVICHDRHKIPANCYQDA